MARNPFAEFNERYAFLFRWHETEDGAYARRASVRDAVKMASDIALARGWAGLDLQSHPEPERALVRTIAAGAALHGSGGFARELGISNEIEAGIDDTQISDLMEQYCSLFNDRREAERVARGLGLRKHEIEAVFSYTQANKEVQSFEDGRANPTYMKKRYGPHANGWDALAEALRRLPNFGKLGMTAVTFRTVRNPAEMEKLRGLRIGDRVVLGCTPMQGGQRHVTSTALTMSKWTIPSAVREGGGVICYFGQSGVLINWLGQYSMGMDGGETLYPPGTIMQVSVKEPTGYDRAHPLVLLEEIPTFEHSDLSNTRYYDDFTYREIRDARVISAARSAAATPDFLDFGSDHDGKLDESFFAV